EMTTGVRVVILPPHGGLRATIKPEDFTLMGPRCSARHQKTRCHVLKQRVRFLSKALAHSSEAPRRAPIPIRLISHPGQSLPKRDPLMPSKVKEMINEISHQRVSRLLKNDEGGGG
ncbi:Junction plakoglobin, partial [Dissostichus eleginoides]